MQHYLTNLRGALVWKLAGLSEREARWPRTPTGTNLLGLVKHVASNEAEYFGVVFDRPFAEPMPWLSDAAEDNDDLYAASEESVASVLAFADRAWAHADATIAALPLDAPGRVPWWASETNEVTLGTILVHVVTELARHTGHADIVRELTDGARGMRDGNTNLPAGDEAWWADYVERLKEIAAAADDGPAGSAPA